MIEVWPGGVKLNRVRLLVLIVFLALCVVTTVRAQEQPGSQFKLSDEDAESMRRQIEEFTRQFKAGENPDYAREKVIGATGMLAWYYRERGKLAEAVDVCRQTTKFFPLDQFSAVRLSEFLLASKNTPEAWKALSPALATSPISAEIASLAASIGVTFLRAGDITRGQEILALLKQCTFSQGLDKLMGEDAVRRLDERVRLAILLERRKTNPRDPGILRDLANAFQAIKDYPNAAKAGRLLTEIEPGQSKNFYSLAASLASLNDAKGALEAANVGGKNDPDQKRFMQERASVYFGLKQYENAIKDYLKVIRNDPDNVDVHVDLAHCYNFLGQVDKVNDELLQVRRLAPEMASKLEKLLRMLR